MYIFGTLSCVTHARFELCIQTFLINRKSGLFHISSGCFINDTTSDSYFLPQKQELPSAKNSSPSEQALTLDMFAIADERTI